MKKAGYLDPKINRKRRIGIMTQKDLTHDEIINRVDVSDGYTCLCGEPLIEDKYGDADCRVCGREYHLCIGIVAGWVKEPTH